MDLKYSASLLSSAHSRGGCASIAEFLDHGIAYILDGSPLCGGVVSSTTSLMFVTEDIVSFGSLLLFSHLVMSDSL